MAKVYAQDFFRPFKINPILNNVDYSKTENYIQAAAAFSRSSCQCVYIIDYKKQGFLYVSDNPFFLCGETAASVLKAGYLFYLRHVPDNDLQMLLEINEAGFSFYRNIPSSERLSYSISYDFHLLQSQKAPMLINHKLTPLALDQQSNLWLSLCVVTHSSAKNAGNIFINKSDGSEIFQFDLKTKEWKREAKVSLSIREKEILALSMRGFTMDDIAEKLFITTMTVKFHRKNILKKLNVDNISEAISYAINYSIL